MKENLQFLKLVLCNNIGVERKSKLAFIELHISILLAGLTGLFGRLVTLNEGLLTFWRLFFTVCIFCVFLIFTKKVYKVSIKDFFKIAAVGGLLGLHLVFFYGSIKYANVSVGTVCLSLISFFTALIDPIINKHRYFKHEFLFSLITICGIVLIFNFDTSYRLGVVIGIFSALLAALFTIFNKRVAKYKSEVVLFYEMVGGLICISLILPFYLYFFPASNIFPSGMNLFYLVILALFCTVFLYYFQISALKKLSAFSVNLSYNLEPVYTIILAIIIFHENKDLNAAFYAGFIAILLSVVLESLYVAKWSKKFNKN